jgi:hypothetical protein
MKIKNEDWNYGAIPDFIRAAKNANHREVYLAIEQGLSEYNYSILDCQRDAVRRFQEKFCSSGNTHCGISLIVDGLDWNYNGAGCFCLCPAALSLRDVEAIEEALSKAEGKQ